MGLIMKRIAKEIVFEGKKPSKRQVLAKVGFLAEIGISLIEVYWGENGLTFDKFNNQWHGWGWIKDISAADIADQLNGNA